VLKCAHWTADVTMHSSQRSRTHAHTGHWLLLQQGNLFIKT